MDENDFRVARIKELLAIHEAAVADLKANGGSEESISMVKQRYDRYGQTLNMIDGPLTRQSRKSRCLCW